MAIIPRNQTILDLFGSGDARLVVPNFQRDFDWGKNEAEELWTDIVSSDRGIYLGNIVIDISDRDRGEISVVDGQQRLTTICLLLIACRSRAIDINETSLANNISSKLTYIDSTTGRSTGPRIKTSPSIREIFDHIIQSDWDREFPQKIGLKSTKKEVKKIKPIYEYFVNKFVHFENISDISNFLNKLYYSFVIRIEVENDVDVFDIFERANARGMELNTAELLKAHLFGLPDLPNIEEKWDEIKEYGRSNLLRVLKYFYVAKRGYITKKDLFIMLKKYAQEVTSVTLTNELSDFSQFYSILNNGKGDALFEYLDTLGYKLLSGNQSYLEKIYRVIEALRLFKVTQPYPTLYSALKSYGEGYKDNQIATKKLIDVFEVIEKYHFINNIICDRIGNEVEKLYADSACHFCDPRNFLLNCANLTSELIKKKAKKEEFVPRFSDLSYTVPGIPLLSYISDRINNYGRKGGQIIKIFIPDRAEFRRNFDIDHFLAQNRKNELNDPELIDNIGNLLIVSRHTNGGMSDKPPIEKLDMLSKNENLIGLPQIKNFLNIYSEEIRINGWGMIQIKNRGSDLATQSYDEIWNF